MNDEDRFIDFEPIIYEASAKVETQCDCGEFVEIRLPFRPSACDECGRKWEVRVHEVNE